MAGLESGVMFPPKDLCGCTVDHFCLIHDPAVTSVYSPIRKFETGATRDTDENKLKYEGFISPLVAKRFAEYMNLHRKQKDGSLRSASNWKKGMPVEVYADSLIRHVHDFWLHIEGYPNEATDQDLESVLCAIRFNVDGYLFELLKKKAGK